MGIRTLSQNREKKPAFSSKKKIKAVNLKQAGLMKEFLGQITRAAYQVALKTGFRGSFIHFLEEVQDALNSVISQDEKRNVLRH